MGDAVDGVETWVCIYFFNMAARLNRHTRVPELIFEGW